MLLLDTNASLITIPKVSLQSIKALYESIRPRGSPSKDFTHNLQVLQCSFPDLVVIDSVIQQAKVISCFGSEVH